MEFPDQISRDLTQKPKSKAFKVLAVVVIIAALVLGAPYARLQFTNYQNRYATEAEARLNVDDIPGAVQALREHAILHPDDIASQIKLAQLIASQGDSESAERIWERILERDRSNDVLVAYNGFISDEVSHYRKLADALWEGGQYAQYIELAPTLLNLLVKYPEIRFRQELASDSLWEVFAAKLVYKQTIPRMSYAHDKLGNIEERDSIFNEFNFIFDFTLDSLFSEDEQESNLSAVVLELQTGFLQLVDEDAEKFFEDKAWLQSAERYEYASSIAKTIWETHQHEPAAYEFARLTFNHAVALGNSERFSQAISLLEGFLQHCPTECFDAKSDWGLSEFQERLSYWKTSVSLHRGYAEYDRIWEQAKAAFADEQWSVAVAKYKQAGDFAKSNHLPDGNAAQAYYNAAMALSNSQRKPEAIALLVGIQSEYPKYEPVLIKEQITVFRKFCTDYKYLCD